jgi:hypothetical protein
MRTVHETEPLRPSDPIPKSMHPSVKSNRLKLIVKAGSPNEGHTPSNGVANGAETSGWTSAYPENLYFTAEEEARGPHELYRLLRRQIIWAGEEGELLKKQCEAMEELRHKEWLEKEVLLDQVISNEIDWHQRRQEVLAGMAQLPSIDAIRAAATGAAPQISQESAIASSPPAIPTLAQKIEEREASSVLASMNPVN